MSYVAPEVHDLAAFAKKAPLEELMWEIRVAASMIETPDVTERARRTLLFLDDMPHILQGTFDQAFLLGYFKATQRQDNEVMQ